MHYNPCAKIVYHSQEVEQFQAAEDIKESELILVIGTASDEFNTTACMHACVGSPGEY